MTGLAGRRVAVIGGREASETLLATAFTVGKALAANGAIVYTGGMGGVMAQACAGARSAGGHTVGILPGDDAAAANPDVVFPVVTGMGFARNAILVRSVEAVVAIGGGVGTLSEIAFALQRGLPVVGIETWPIDSARTNGHAVIPATTGDEAIARLVGHFGPLPAIDPASFTYSADVWEGLAPAICAVIVREGQVLFIQRAPAARAPFYWTPVTGQVEPGETHEEAVVREVREEVGLAVRPGPFLWECPTSNARFRLRWYAAEMLDPTVIPQPAPDEVLQWRWLAPGEIAAGVVRPLFADTLFFFRHRPDAGLLPV